MALIEEFVDKQIQSSPYFWKLQEDVDRLQKATIDYKTSVDKCFDAIKDSKDANTAQVKQIKRTLKSVEHGLEVLHKRQSKVNDRSLSKEMTRVKLHGGFLIAVTSTTTVTITITAATTAP
ncbi:hypothetical protein H4582DRAFT_2051936 [Lactarius indigo]|nr:hypothetical protein H4582DRAFT_2051936 [Lactarius indigo]